jgi:hypothetical protein
MIPPCASTFSISRRAPCDQFADLGGNHRRAVEDVPILEQVGLEGHHLLHAQRPLLIPRAWQPHRLVPRRQLDGARARALGQRDGQHLEDDPLHVVFRLCLGQAQRVDLHAIAEAAQLGISHLVAGQRQLVPHLAEGAQLAALLDEADAGIDEERDPLDDLRKLLRRDLARSLDPVENRHRGAQGVSQFLHRRRPGFLQVVAADVGRVPLRHVLHRVVDRVGDQAHRRAGG